MEYGGILDSMHSVLCQIHGDAWNRANCDWDIIMISRGPAYSLTAVGVSNHFRWLIIGIMVSGSSTTIKQLSSCKQAFR